MTITSSTAGTFTANATAAVSYADAFGDTLTVTRSTSGNSGPGGSGPATKVFADAAVSISPNGINEVNHPHTFTITATALSGGGSVTGFVITPSISPAPTSESDTCGTPTVSGNTATCTVTITSSTPGTFTANATAAVSFADAFGDTLTVTRSTSGNSGPGGSGPATKVFVDAAVSIAPSATNGITEAHTFTITATALPDGGSVTGFAITPSVSPAPTSESDTCANPLVSGNTATCTMTINSNSPGTFTANATAAVSFADAFGDTLTVTRSTSGNSGPGGSGPATKTFVAGSLRWLKVDGFGNPLAGATFLVCATGGTAASAGHTPLCQTVVDNGPFDADPAGGKFLLNAYQMFGGSPLTGLALGTYTIQETVPPTGYTLDPKVLTATLTLAAPNADLSSSPFVDTLPNLAITKQVTSGFPSTIHPGDTASFTITVTNPGAGTAINVVVTDQLPDPANKLTWTASGNTAGTCSVSSTDLLTCNGFNLVGGGSFSVTVSTVVPTNFFFNGGGGGPGNGDPVPLGLFELDGNAKTGVLDGGTGSQTTSHDWDQVFADAGSPTASGSFSNGPTSGALAGSFVTDAKNTNSDDIFQGGGSKDTLGIQQGQWLFTGGKPQGKDDITHAYAADYTDPVSNDQILYAGLDRFDNSGDSTAGFWFFKNPISENPNVTTNGGHPFVGTHSDGDILLVSDFTVGGSTSTIRVFRWTGNDSTGSLVALNSGNPINGSTFAVVNSAAIPVPWAYTNKSKQTQPAAGEFLEEGINLSGLGLQGCFSSFLAETRSSQSPTATLSDFTLGSFNTCMETLPNTATVRADNNPPVTSNQVIITIVGSGSPQLAASLGRGAPDSLTLAQLQPLVAQASTLWRAAGIDPRTLSSLDQVTVHVANLPHGELGWTQGNDVWIDGTAAGWGWSLDGSQAAGRMDLLTVVTHELGHVLGYGDDSGAAVMATTLAPGVQRAPEAAPVTGNIVVSAAADGAGAPAVAGVGELAVGQPGVPLSTSSGTEAGGTAFTGVRRGGLALPLPAAAAVPAGSFQDGAGHLRLVPGVVLNLGPQAPPLPATAPAAPAAGAVGEDRDPAADVVPGLRPPVPRVDRGAASPAGDEEPDTVPDDRPAPPAGAPVDAGAADAIGALRRLPARDAFFAGGFTMADPGADSGQALAAALVVALGGLGGHGYTQRAEPEPRRQRRFVS
jgi:uncharacterized repeat protein (TIGR01451 family)